MIYREATDGERRDHPDVEMLAVMPVKLDYAAAAAERDRQLRNGILDATAIVDAAHVN